MGFDLAFCFKKDLFNVKQLLNISSRRFAPEIEAGFAHGLPADVWSLGLIAQQLLGMNTSQSESSVQLINIMVANEPSERPTIT